MIELVGKLLWFSGRSHPSPLRCPSPPSSDVTPRAVHRRVSPMWCTDQPEALRSRGKRLRNMMALKERPAQRGALPCAALG